MIYLKKILLLLRRKLISCLRFFPFVSKYSGAPTGYYASSSEYFLICREKNLNNVTYRSFLPTSITERKPPKSIYKKDHSKFDSQSVHDNPETFLISIPSGRVFGESGAIITPDNKLLFDVSLQFGIGKYIEKINSHHVFNHLKFPKYKDSPETIAVLSTAGEGRYFHWLTEALPRIEILRRTLPNALTEIDKYVVNQGVPIIEESLKMLGIPADHLIFADANCHIKAQQLIVPSLPGGTGNPPLWACEFLRDNFLKHKADIPPIDKIYISRSKAICRKVANEQDVLECLEKFGFTPIWLEDYDFATQIALFANAKFIIAPHGAGLTNLVWCKSNAKVLEIFPPTYVNVCFWAIANNIGIEYYYLIGDGTENRSFLDPLTFEDKIDVPIEKLKQSLDIMLSKT